MSLTVTKAVILGIIQGLTEFLPVSSSGHLVIAQSLLGISLPGVTFEVVVHFGTLVAVVAAFFGDIREILAGTLRAIMNFRRNPISRLWSDTQARLGVLIVVTMVPTGIVGFALKPYFERLYDSPRAVGVALLITGALLLAVSRINQGRRGIDKVSLADAVVIGAMQGLAITPGISRSGSTIAAGLFRGLSRETAARFSFLMSVPAVLGATLLDLKDVLEGTAPSLPLAPLALAAIASAITGYIAIRWLLRVVKAGGLGGFAWYCFTVGTLVLFWQGF